MSLLNQRVVLQLNAYWEPVHFETPETALTDMAKDPATLRGMVIVDRNTFYPVSWEDWINLPPLNPEFTVRTPKLSIRIPTVVIAANYRSRPPMRQPALTRQNLHLRDKSTCAYSGKKLSPEDLSADHIMPESRGGEESWENLVTCHKRINEFKGNRTPDEAGLKLRIVPKAPRPLPVGLLIRNAHRVGDWDLFLKFD